MNVQDILAKFALVIERKRDSFIITLSTAGGGGEEGDIFV